MPGGGTHSTLPLCVGMCEGVSVGVYMCAHIFMHVRVPVFS